jgi:hypothetical protein
VAGKSNRGLPPSFSLDIPDPTPDPPVQLGDYLDEVDAAPLVPSKPALPRREETSPKVVEMRRPTEPKAEPSSPPAPSESSEPTGTKSAAQRRRKKIKGPARKQINASPETLRMIEELIDHVQTYSVQKDAKASEVFHALVLALYEAREFIDLSDVPARGRWGTPTAKAFPILLKNAFQDAIAGASRKGRR